MAHVTVLRNAMLEVRWGEAQASWLELGVPALKSLRAMAAEVGHTALVAALDGFVGALQAVLEPGQPPEVTGSSRDTLLAAYAPLATCLPRAFALEGERDRREPIVVRALLEQVADLEPLMVDKLMAAGLGTLAALFAARADEIAAVTGIPDAIAGAGGRAHPGVPPRDPGGAGDGRSGGDDPRARPAARAAAHRAHGVRGGRARLVGRRAAGQEGAPAAAAGDFLADHDRAGPPGRDRLRPAPAEAAVRAADRRSGTDRRQPGGRGPATGREHGERPASGGGLIRRIQRRERRHG